ncbi:MAG: RrF2 family transcriptional regulator [Lachnospiraceae bacterium]|nr:RrF2 family transcriptional regulator [Lachnospiraceae bacterium]
MRLSTKGRYGLKAIIDLAIHSTEAPVSIHSISVRQEISERYLEQIIARLKKAGLVISVRGVSGGYRLAKPAAQISVGEVLYALEGDLNPVDCQALSGAEGCKNSDVCLTKYVWQQIHESIQNTVDHIYLGELVERGKGCRKGSSDE